ncbi:MAG: hypothetical protein KDK36_09350 [Leptospiraceae bacterium]|nr:hypothetical protein [Leptospiraceae bacterium]
MSDILDKIREPITSDEMFMVKLFSYGIKDFISWEEVRKIYFDKKEKYPLRPDAVNLEEAIHLFLLKAPNKDERQIIRETVELFLEDQTKLEIQKIKTEASKLDIFGSLGLDISRMLPKGIDFTKKDWMILENWAKFDPVTSTLMLIFWGLLYGFIIYYFYL